MRGRFAVSPVSLLLETTRERVAAKEPVAADRHLRPTRERSAGREPELVTKRVGGVGTLGGGRDRDAIVVSERDGRRVTHARDPRRRAAFAAFAAFAAEPTLVVEPVSVV